MKILVKQFVSWLSLKEIIRLRGIKAKFTRDYGLNKRYQSVNHVWCLDPVNIRDFFEKIQDYQAKPCN